MTLVVSPAYNSEDKFNLGLCCDRRGDDLLMLGDSLSSVDDIASLWGSSKHWDIFDKIKVNECPRCTYQPHNKIFEHVIEDDNMTYRFI